MEINKFLFFYKFKYSLNTTAKDFDGSTQVSADSLKAEDS